MEDTMSPAARREAANDLIDGLVERNGFPQAGIHVPGANRNFSAPGLRTWIGHATPYELVEIHRALGEAESAMLERAQHDREQAERDERRDHLRTPLTELPPDVAALRAESNRLAEYRASTEGRLEAIEGLLREIRDGLAKR